jgi:hypothetical protein
LRCDDEIRVDFNGFVVASDEKEKSDDGGEGGRGREDEDIEMRENGHEAGTDGHNTGPKEDEGHERNGNDQMRKGRRNIPARTQGGIESFRRTVEEKLQRLARRTI